MTDSEIEQWVLRELRFAGNIQSREVCVSADQGIVTLGGTVPTRISRVAAKKAALSVRGVKSVVNNLRALPSRNLREPGRVIPKPARAVTTVVSQPRSFSDPAAVIH